MTELATQDKRITEAEGRIEGMENWNIEAKEALLQSLKQQKILQDKLTDQEGRNRRNNIRIFGLKEGTEGSSVARFIEQLLKQELPLPTNMELQIQRAHRALMPRPDADKPPRSIVVNFLQYTVKETVLKEAWKKKIHYQNQPFFFDHDYAAEVIQKRKEYNGIKRALKEKNMLPDAPDENKDPLGNQTADIRQCAGGYEGAAEEGDRGGVTGERRSQDGDGGAAPGGAAVATCREPRRHCYASQEKTSRLSKEMMV